jgi:hypothetical protein
LTVSARSDSFADVDNALQDIFNGKSRDSKYQLEDYRCPDDGADVGQKWGHLIQRIRLRGEQLIQSIHISTDSLRFGRIFWSPPSKFPPDQPSRVCSGTLTLIDGLGIGG